MNIHEYQAKPLFRAYAIPVPEGQVATSIAEAVEVAKTLGGEQWVVKAQIHAGGRGKAGGVKLLNSLAEVSDYTQQLLGQRLVTAQTDAHGLPIQAVLVEKPYSILREFYLSLLVDRSCEQLMFVASAAGGMDIEEVARETPDKIYRIHIHPAAGLQSYHCRELAFAFGLTAPQAKILEQIMRGLYQLLINTDANQIEINPLIETSTGELLALDAKMNFDANALALHPEIAALKDATQEDERENIAQQFGLNYITLEGNIACMVNGAGLAMATMDLIQLNGGKPANFLDVGGGTNTAKVTEAFKLILADKNVKAILVNIFGGIVKCDVIAEGILAAVKQIELKVPVVVRLEGTNAELGRNLLSQSELSIIAAKDLATAAKQVVQLAEKVA